MDRAEFQSLTGVSRETLDGYDIWRETLMEWNAHTNLVGRSTLDDFWLRHALDSWQVSQVSPEAHVWLDIGSGAGMPGIAIALDLKERAIPGGHVHLVESIHKKAAFLKDVIEKLGVPATVHSVRVEMLDLGLPIDCVTARAVASLDKLLGYAEPFTKKGAKAVFPKGARHNEELTQAQKSWTFKSMVIPSRTAEEAALLKLEDIVRVQP